MTTRLYREYRMRTANPETVRVWTEAMPQLAEEINYAYDRVVVFRQGTCFILLSLASAIVLLSGLGVVYRGVAPMWAGILSALTVHICWRYTRRWSKRPVLVIVRTTEDREDDAGSGSDHSSTL